MLLTRYLSGVLRGVQMYCTIMVSVQTLVITYASGAHAQARYTVVCSVCVSVCVSVYCRVLQLLKDQ